MFFCVCSQLRTQSASMRITRQQPPWVGAQKVFASLGVLGFVEQAARCEGWRDQQGMAAAQPFDSSRLVQLPQQSLARSQDKRLCEHHDGMSRSVKPCVQLHRP